MVAFAEINVSPVTISKRHAIKKLDSLYSYFEMYQNYQNIPVGGELIDVFSKGLGLPQKYGEHQKDKAKADYASEEYLSIPQKYFYFINQDNRKYYKLLKAHLDKKDIPPSKIYDLMLQLQPSSFVTTNYDTLIEQAAIANGQLYHTIAQDEDIPDIDGEKFILKIHGDFKKRNVVLKEEDYLKYSDNFKMIEAFVKSLFATNTVVFIGYGLNDYNVKLILSWVKEALGSEKFKKPYFIHTDDMLIDDIERRYQGSRGLQIIDWHDFIEPALIKTDIFEKRYNAVLQKIVAKKSNYSKMPKEQLFDTLYEKLAPLNELFTLRTQHVQQALENNCIVREDGIIQVIPDKPDFFEFYCELYKLTETNKTIPHVYIEKYQLITSVFIKAWITGYRNTDGYAKQIMFKYAYTIGSSFVLSLDYRQMEKAVLKKSSNFI